MAQKKINKEERLQMIPKKKRLSIYRHLRDEYVKAMAGNYTKNDMDDPRWHAHDSGLCDTLFAIHLRDWNRAETHIENYPELMAQKPRKVYAGTGITEWWWKAGSMEPRLKAIDRAIAMITEK